ncbi:CheR family methyltransferase [Tumidithrix elongata RA019]|uniref:protein-glutamate O-methyltransferase n=1 Tax=Tumidithrix elongata BACA0141 TaxID=2716417 RepID=A0AAW9Q8F6_9CYAN|nr:CheR family methyltransferase [Tumidithrix elongata RA019]
MNPTLLQDFVQLIARHTGIQVQEKDRGELVKKIALRMTAQKLTTPEVYYQLLAIPSTQGSSGEADRLMRQEWEDLTLLLTTGETYFFRDRGQINLIKETILPEIIDQKLQAQAIVKTKPSLRIWSAGCSTGEEAYSLATMVKELIPNYLNWNLLILGTDINTESIEKAKAANYSEWSFRMVNPEVKRQYFTYQDKKQDKSWQLNEQMRRMVTFRAGNLLTDDYPNLSSNIYNMDIILCRNVFIYFNAADVETILGKFYKTLSSYGCLIVGHTELQDLNLQGFVPKVYEESIVYLRSEDMKLGQAISKSPAITQSRTTTERTIASQPLVTPSQTPLVNDSSTIKVKPVVKPPDRLVSSLELHNAKMLFERGEYPLVLQRVETILKQQPDNFEATYLMAQTYANLGQYEPAIAYCKQAIALNSMSMDIYHLLAHIAEEQGNLSQAKEYLKRTIYIDETAIAAYLDLGSIYKKEGDDRRAKKMFAVATELLEALPPDSTIQYRDKAKVSELLQQVKRNL